MDLARHFGRVVATDLSAEQLAAAPPHPKIEYRTAPAEASGLADRSADLVTVAQALHWLDLDRFYAEATRVLVSGGVIAVWSYGLMQTGDAAIDATILRFYADTLGPFWPPERRHVESGYRTLPFPFDELALPSFRMDARWTLEHLLGYLGTWSATRRYVAARGSDPVEPLARQLVPCWGDPDERRRIVWPLTVRAGRS